MCPLELTIDPLSWGSMERIESIKSEFSCLSLIDFISRRSRWIPSFFESLLALSSISLKSDEFNFLEPPIGQTNRKKSKDQKRFWKTLNTYSSPLINPK